ncbi:MAG TPA: inorganic pyrophosphatase [Pyrinomonadaceae bacterium]|jgi:inorganic pyrophosphatase|nr:inorganic pyrophosphatase [Pyrinomonadaceae bacterium]
MERDDAALDQLLAVLFQAHPWHGVAPGADAPRTLNAFIEIVPTDVVKYELDKASGHLRVDRPQRFSSLCPMPYGFIPQSYCGDRVGELCSARVGQSGIRGDGDPMDICVLTEKTFSHGDFFVTARPIGGLRMIDGQEADDKIIAVLEADVAYGHIENITQCPPGLVDRLKHYFLSYKQLPNDAPRRVEIAEVYERTEAIEVIAHSFLDYRDCYGAPEERLGQLRRLLKE